MQQSLVFPLSSNCFMVCFKMCRPWSHKNALSEAGDCHDTAGCCSGSEAVQSCVLSLWTGLSLNSDLQLPTHALKVSPIETLEPLEAPYFSCNCSTRSCKELCDMGSIACVPCNCAHPYACKMAEMRSEILQLKDSCKEWSSDVSRICRML